MARPLEFQPNYKAGAPQTLERSVLIQSQREPDNRQRPHHRQVRDVVGVGSGLKGSLNGPVRKRLPNGLKDAMYVFPKNLSTDRLRLRVPTREDAEEMFVRYANDAEVSRYLSWTPHRSVRETAAFVERAIADRENGSSFSWLVYPLRRGPLLGSIGCRNLGTTLQLGYCLARDAWGRGIATEATLAFLTFAFVNENVWRVQAYCDVENPASARVLQKAGLELEGVLRRYMIMPNLGDMPRDVFCYAKVRA
jgi:[ribosomal protein S5]-alanine N-acetyltransferase